MDNTEQFNLRLSKELIADLEFISKRKRIQKTEWVRYNLAEIINEQKAKLMDELNKEFVLSKISKIDYVKLTGQGPDDDLLEKRRYVSGKVDDIMKNGIHREFARKALLNGAPETEVRNNKEDRKKLTKNGGTLF